MVGYKRIYNDWSENMRKFGKVAIGLMTVFSLVYAAGISIGASQSEEQANELPERTVEYKGAPIQVYFGNPEEEGSIELTKWSNGWSDEMVKKVLTEMEKTTGIPLAEIDTDE